MTKPTYADYLAYAKERGFQPMSEATFDRLVALGLDPIRNRWDSLSDYDF